MNRHSNDELVAFIMSDLGYDAKQMTDEEYLNILSAATLFGGVCPGACRECGGVQDCEPDATRNHCYDCGAGAVVSLPVLAGLM